MHASNIPVKLLPGETMEDAIKRILKGRAFDGTNDEKLVAAIRVEGYNDAMKQLHAEEEEQRREPAREPIRKPEGIPSPTTTDLLRNIAMSLRTIEVAIVSGNSNLLQTGALIFNMSALELNALFSLLNLPGMRLGVDMTQDPLSAGLDMRGGFDVPQDAISALLDTDAGDAWPAELWAQFTAEEKGVVYGLSPANIMTEEQQPYCDFQPCPGCDLRRKVNAFRQLEALQRARPH